MLCIVSVSVHSLCIVLLLFKFDGSSKLKKFDALIRVVTRSFMCFAPRDILAVKKELGHSTQCSHGKAKKVFSTTSSWIMMLMMMILRMMMMMMMLR